MAFCYIGFGSNIGDRKFNIVHALSLLIAKDDIRLDCISGLYETQPVGFVDQADFLNGAVCVETMRTPASLLAACLQVERKLLRKRIVRWGPRTIDLDILLFEEVISTTEELTIPHKELENRRFVLAPLAEIAANVKAPNSKKTIDRLLRETKDVSRVELVVESTELLSMIKKV